MPEVIARTRVVNGITLDRRRNDDRSTPDYIYRRDHDLDVRFEYDGYWHRTVWRYRRGEVPLIASVPESWLSLADAVQAARADGLITFDTSMPTDVVGTGMDGHLYEYPVRDRRGDGSLVTTSYNAAHLDSCRCFTDPEFWH
jgi:hypothetical protein